MRSYSGSNQAVADKEGLLMALILVIDDDAPVRELIRRVLVKDGYEVVEAPNGKVGVALFEQKRPDLVITDILMPEMEGAETIIHIRSHRPHAKIIAISGGSQLLDSSVCLRVGEMVGASAMLVKPINKSDLLRAVHELLKG
jgi:CheY-like chemotaxis protein